MRIPYPLIFPSHLHPAILHANRKLLERLGRRPGCDINILEVNAAMAGAHK